MSKQKGLSRILALLLALLLFVPAAPGLVPLAAAADDVAGGAGGTDVADDAGGADGAAVYVPPAPTPGLSVDSNGVLEIAENAQLSGEVVIPENVTIIPESAFWVETGITSVVIPNGVKEIQKSAFYGCIGLTSVTIPGTVNDIGEAAFAQCTGLEDLYILYGVKSIGLNAFAGCKNLKNVAISPSVETLPKADPIFDKEASDIKVQSKPGSAIAGYIQNVEGQHEDYPVSTKPFDADSPVVYDYKVTPEGTVIEGYFGDSDTIEIPEEINGVPVTGIGDNAFDATANDGQNTDVVSVSLPESLRTIGTNAFAGCDALLDIIIPKSVTGIGEHAFNGATKVTLLFENEDLYEEWKSRNLNIKFELWKPGMALHNTLTIKSDPAEGYSSLTAKIVGQKENIISGTGEYKVRRNAEVQITVVPKQRAGNQTGYRFTGWKIQSNYVAADESTGEPIKDEEVQNLIDTPNLTRATLKMPSYPITITATFAVVNREPLYIRHVENGVIDEEYTGTAGVDGGTVLESNTAKDEFDKIGIGVNIPETHWDTDALKDTSWYNVTRIGLTNYNDGIVFLDPAMKHLVFGPKITEIHDRAFEQASGLESIQMSGKRDVAISDNTMSGAGAFAKNEYFTCDGVLFKALGSSNYELIAYPKHKSGAYTVPNGVTTIHYNAFENCTGLTDINLNGVTEIGVCLENDYSHTAGKSYAFSGCSGLISADLGALIVLPRNTFNSCRNLKSVKCNSVQTIGTEAFINCRSLAEVDMPNVVTIKNDAFYYCRALTTLTNMVKVVTIGNSAFEDTGLTTVTIPGTIKIIGDMAFDGAPLTNVSWGVTAEDNSSHLKTIGEYAFANTELAEAVFPEKVTVTFEQNERPDTGTLAGGGITVMSGAYANCNIETVTLTAAIDTLASDAFEGCSNLRSYSLDTTDTEHIKAEEIDVASGETTQKQTMSYSTVPGYKYVVIDDVLFRYTKPTEVTDQKTAELILMSYPVKKTDVTGEYVVPDKVVALDDSALYGAQFKSINLNNVKSLGDKALAFSKITAIDFRNVESLGTSVLSYCDGLTMVGWPNKDIAAFKTIPAGTFTGSKNLKHVRLGSNVTTIGAKAFSNCAALTSVDMRAFNDTGILETDGEDPATPVTPYKLPDSITTIGDYAFYNCPALAGIIFPEAGESGTSDNTSPKLSIGKYAFSQCSALGEVAIPANTTFVEDAYGDSYAFMSSGITSLKCDATKIPGNTFSRCSKLETAELTSKVIGAYAFMNCGKLSTLKTDDATTIGSYAFYGCSSIDGVSLPKVSSVGRYAFNGCTSIPALSLGEAAEKVTLYEGAFYGCKNISTLTLANVKIGKYAFKNCTSINNPTITGTDTIEVSAFEGCSGLITLNLSGANKVGTIGNYAFRNCTKLENLSINATTINTSAFQNCGNDAAVMNLTLEGAVTISTLAFENCNKLVTVELPANLNELKDRAFTTCEKLESISVKDNGTTAGGYFAADGVLYKNGAEGTCELIEYPQNKANQPTDTGDPGAGENDEASDKESYNANYTVDTVNDKTITEIHVYAFESNNYLESIQFAPTVKKFGHSLFYRSDKIKTLYILNDEDGPNKASSPEFTFYSAQKDEGIFYGVSNEVRKNIIVYGYSGTNTEMVCLKYRVFGIKFISLNDAPAGLVIRVWGSNGEPASESTTEFFGEVINYNPTVTTNEDGTTSFATDIIIPGVINESNKKNVTLVAPKDKTGAENVDFDASRITGNTTITVTRIASNMFGDHAADITSVSLPQTIREIGMSAFEGCEKISVITIPESVETIKPYAFKGTSITTINIPGNVRIMSNSEILNDQTQTSEWVSAFSGAEKLGRIEVDPKNGVYRSIDGVLFTKNGVQGGQMTLLEVPAALSDNSGNLVTEYTIPDNTYSIGSNSFCANHNLTTVRIPNSVQDIGVGAFEGCFDGKTEPASIVFVNAVNEPGDGLDIQNRAFAENPGLKTVQLPWYVARLGDDVFAGCDNITDFFISDGYNESFGTKQIDVKDGVLYGHTVFVNNGVETENYALYKYPSGRDGSAYTISDEFDKDIPVRQIYKSAFQNNKKLKSITLSSETQVIQDSAFENCVNLQHVDFNNATSGNNAASFIGPLAFANTALGKPYEVSGKTYRNPLYIPSTINSIGRQAFASCKNLTEVYILNPSTVFEYDENDPSSDIFGNGAESLTIYGKKGSTAEAYANNHGYNFKEITGVATFTATIDESAKNWVSFVSKDGKVNTNSSLIARAGDEIKVQITRVRQVADGDTPVDEILGNVKVREQVEGNEFSIYEVDTDALAEDGLITADGKIDSSKLQDPKVVEVISFHMPSNNVTIGVDLYNPAQAEQSLMSVEEETTPILSTGPSAPSVPSDPSTETSEKPSSGGSSEDVETGLLEPSQDKEDSYKPADGDEQAGGGEQTGGSEQAGGGEQTGGSEQAGGGEQAGGSEQAGGGEQTGGSEQAGGGEQTGGSEQTGDSSLPATSSSPGASNGPNV